MDDLGVHGDIVPPGAQTHALAPLPIAGLRLPAALCEELDRLGLRRIADLLALPRAGLAARFGAVLGRRLDQACGDVDAPISPLSPPPRLRFRLNFPEPIGHIEDVVAGSERLLAAATAKLTALGQGARQLTLSLYRVGGEVDMAAAGTSRANRDPAHLLRLLKEKLDRLPMPRGVESQIETLLLGIGRTDPLAAAQAGFATGPTEMPAGGADPVAGLADRLMSRLGAANVLRLQPRESHLPERAQIAVPAAAHIGDPGLWSPLSRPRPLRLLARQPVSRGTGRWPGTPGARLVAHPAVASRRRNTGLLPGRGPPGTALLAVPAGAVSPRRRPPVVSPRLFWMNTIC